MKPERVKEIKKALNTKFESEFINLLSRYGVPADTVEILPELMANRKPEPGETYYYYVGPNDEKTREFCKHVLTIDKVFSLTDIEIMSNYLNYDVLKYKGSYNCRHSWVRFRGKSISTPEPTTNQIRSLVRKGIKG